MPKVTDNELDRMFRLAADRVTPAFDPQDWQEMSRRLDNGEREAKARNITLYSMLGLLLMYSFISPWTTKDKAQEVSMIESPVATEIITGKDTNRIQSESSAIEPAAHQQSAKETDVAEHEQPVASSKAIRPELITGKHKNGIQSESSAIEPAVAAHQQRVKETDTAEREHAVASSMTTMPELITGPDTSRIQSESSAIEPGVATRQQRVKETEIAEREPAAAGSKTTVPELITGKDTSRIQSESAAIERSVATHQQRVKETDITEREHPVVDSKGTGPGQQSPANLKDSQDSQDTLIDQLAFNKEPDGTRYRKPLQAEKVEEPLLSQTKAGEGAQRKTEIVPGRLPGEKTFVTAENRSSGKSSVKMESETGNEGNVHIKGDDSDDSSEGFVRSGRPSVYSQLRDHPTSVVQKNAEIDVDKIIRPVRLPLTDSVSEKTIVKNERTFSSHQWYLKIPVSPDFSSIDFNKLGATGINIGLMGEYVMGKHLSISTGAIWSKKLYDQKNPDKWYSTGTWSAKPSMLNGDCRVLDIPINITYYLFPQRKTSLFVSVGSSSYIMLKEKYVYTVTWNQNDYLYEENFSNKNNAWFSMLNVSIGVQQRIGKRFFAQAEPFLKAPISGVGEGKVNLMSTGVFFSLKYSLSKGN